MKKAYKNVLVMDDSEADQLIARKIMQLTGFAQDISVKNSRQSALDFISDARNNHKDLPDIIFLDINRPAIEGFSFLHDFENMPAEVRENCKIIILSSIENRHDINNIADYAYVEKILVKPLTVDAMLMLLG